MATELHNDEEWIVVPSFDGSNLNLWIAEMEALMMRYDVPSIQWVNFSHVYTTDLARKWVIDNEDHICWMSWSQFVRALRAKFEVNKEKISVSSAVAEPSEPVALDSPNLIHEEDVLDDLPSPVVLRIPDTALTDILFETTSQISVQSSLTKVWHHFGFTSLYEYFHSVSKDSLSFNMPTVGHNIACKLRAEHRVMSMASITRGISYDMVPLLGDYIAPVDVPIAWTIDDENNVSIDDVNTYRSSSIMCIQCVQSSWTIPINCSNNVRGFQGDTKGLNSLEFNFQVVDWSDIPRELWSVLKSVSSKTEPIVSREVTCSKSVTMDYNLEQLSVSHGDTLRSIVSNLRVSLSLLKISSLIIRSSGKCSECKAVVYIIPGWPPDNNIARYYSTICAYLRMVPNSMLRILLFDPNQSVYKHILNAKSYASYANFFKYAVLFSGMTVMRSLDDNNAVFSVSVIKSSFKLLDSVADLERYTSNYFVFQYVMLVSSALINPKWWTIVLCIEELCEGPPELCEQNDFKVPLHHPCLHSLSTAMEAREHGVEWLEVCTLPFQSWFTLCGSSYLYNKLERMDRARCIVYNHFDILLNQEYMEDVVILRIGPGIVMTCMCSFEVVYKLDQAEYVASVWIIFRTWPSYCDFDTFVVIAYIKISCLAYGTGDVIGLLNVMVFVGIEHLSPSGGPLDQTPSTVQYSAEGPTVNSPRHTSSFKAGKCTGIMLMCFVITADYNAVFTFPIVVMPQGLLPTKCIQIVYVVLVLTSALFVLDISSKYLKELQFDTIQNELQFVFWIMKCNFFATLHRIQCTMVGVPWPAECHFLGGNTCKACGWPYLSVFDPGIIDTMSCSFVALCCIILSEVSLARKMGTWSALSMHLMLVRILVGAVCPRCMLLPIQSTKVLTSFFFFWHTNFPYTSTNILKNRAALGTALQFQLSESEAVALNLSKLRKACFTPNKWKAYSAECSLGCPAHWYITFRRYLFSFGLCILGKLDPKSKIQDFTTQLQWVFYSNVNAYMVVCLLVEEIVPTGSLLLQCSHDPKSNVQVTYQLDAQITRNGVWLLFKCEAWETQDDRPRRVWNAFVESLLLGLSILLLMSGVSLLDFLWRIAWYSHLTMMQLWLAQTW